MSQSQEGGFEYGPEKSAHRQLECPVDKLFRQNDQLEEDIVSSDTTIVRRESGRKQTYVTLHTQKRFFNTRTHACAQGLTSFKANPLPAHNSEGGHKNEIRFHF